MTIYLLYVCWVVHDSSQHGPMRLHRYGRAYGDRRDKKKRPGDGQGDLKTWGIPWDFLWNITIFNGFYSWENPLFRLGHFQ